MSDDNTKVEIDDWASAFAALNKKDEEDDKATSDNDTDGGATDADSKQPVVQEVPDNDAAEHNDETSIGIGGSDSVPGSDGEEGGFPDVSAETPITDDYQSYRKEVEQNIRDRAIDDIAQEFIKRGVRHDKKTGMLGASTSDEDICKYDDDGVPHFFNPDTKQEFKGDDPEGQAEAWVTRYNNKLANSFNAACAQYEKQLLDAVAPQLAVREFAPKYDKLDPVRQKMFDIAITGYEKYDENGNVIGHSVDYNAVLDMVNKQIGAIQDYAKANKSTDIPTGPALDMKTSSGAIPSGDRPAPTSLSEAMERIQDDLIANMKR